MQVDMFEGWAAVAALDTEVPVAGRGRGWGAASTAEGTARRHVSQRIPLSGIILDCWIRLVK